jgi:hypothetical protein
VEVAIELLDAIPAEPNGKYRIVRSSLGQAASPGAGPST